MKCENNSFLEKLDGFLIKYLGYFNYRNYTYGIDFCGDEKVLEVGCGGGNLSKFIFKKFRGELTCLDVSNYWLYKSKRRLRDFNNIKFILSDILNFKKKDYFDVVVVHYVLHDIIDKNKAIGVFRKCLKKNGVVYLREPMRKSHGISVNEIRDLFLKNGFIEDKFWKGYSFPLRGKVCEFIFRK